LTFTYKSLAVEGTDVRDRIPSSLAAHDQYRASLRVMMRTAKPKGKPPHPFIVEALAPLNPEVRPMFSGFAVYVGDRLVLMLRDAAKSARDNGVWLVLSEATDPADEGLRREFPSLRRIELLGNKIGHWLVIPSDSPSFEKEALHACDLLLRHDVRLGRIPQSRR
jgi:hypothetical protein